MTSTELTVVKEVRSALDKMTPEFGAVLPSHISPAAFIRVAQTAIQQNEELQFCSKKSLLASCTKCAEAGLVPDGEEAALVAYNVKVSKKGQPDRWEKQAKFMPMIRGLRKQVQQSGQVKDWYARIVYSKDYFRFICGDEEKLEHEPAFEENDHPLRVYSIAKLENGEISRHVMRIDQVEKIRRRSRNADRGPWVSDYEEMVKKTCMRQHFKGLPRAKDDVARQRLMTSIGAFDDNQAVIDVDAAKPSIAAPAPALSVHENASSRLREAVENTAFDEDTGEIMGPAIAPAELDPEPDTPAPPPAARKGRKTAAEKLAEADAGRQAKQAPATNGRPPEAKPNDRLIEDYERHVADQAAAQANGQEPGEEEEDDPQIIAFRAGWINRTKLKSRTPPVEIARKTELRTFYEQGWDMVDGLMKSGGGPRSAEENEQMLDGALEKVFN